MITLTQVLEKNDFAFRSITEMPIDLYDFAFKGDGERRWYDLVTPLQNGKEWICEPMLPAQPRTAKILLSGSAIRLVARKFEGSYICALVQEVNGQVIQIHRQFWGSNPDDPDYQANVERTNAKLTERWGEPRKMTQRHLSLPEPIRKAYYERIDGLRIPDSPSVYGIYGRILPYSSGGEWQSIDGYLGDLKLKKKLLPVIEEMIPDVKPKQKDLPYTNFMMFLNSWGSFTGQKRTDGDHLFVKNHIQDGVVYYIRDADVANMMILADPAEAVDRYCEHVLLRKDERFDFRPWAVPFEQPRA